MITIRRPLCFSEIGLKDNQEDYLYPQQVGSNTRVFIMCDGMGGHEKGEVASMTAANALGDYLNECSVVTPPVFEKGLDKAYDALDDIDPRRSDRAPGTTMTCLCLNENNYLVAHIGDSRIYHIRPSQFNPELKRGGIKYQSSDHSLVNDLLKAGEITEEEARVFPQKNIITKAMQPHLEKRYRADVFLIDDIEGGDYFFLCSDGVMEQLTNETLCSILADQSLDDEEKMAKIKSVCRDKTRDNYTAWLIPIDKVRIDGVRTQNPNVLNPAAPNANVPPAAQRPQQQIAPGIQMQGARPMPQARQSVQPMQMPNMQMPPMIDDDDDDESPSDSFVTSLGDYKYYILVGLVIILLLIFVVLKFII